MKSYALFGVALALCPCSLFAQARPAAAKSVAAAKAPVTQFDRNLLQNPGAETRGKDDKDVRGWAKAEGLSDNEYGSVSGEWDWGLSGCSSCAKYYLRLEFGSGVHELVTSQTIDVAPSSAQIDKSGVTASISAYLGGFLKSATVATISASFQDAAGKELGRIETKPYDTSTLPKAQSGSTGLTLCEASGTVPVGTRKIVFTWKATASDDSGDYLGLGDNFSLVLSLPKPQ